jgi:hypothetical protein
MSNTHAVPVNTRDAFTRERQLKWGISVNPVTDNFTLFRLVLCHSHSLYISSHLDRLKHARE